MKHNVYILVSELTGDYYKGYTADPARRLAEHNNNQSTFTADKGPWKMIFLSVSETKKEALQFEKKLKRQHRRYLDWLLTQPINLIK